MELLDLRWLIKTSMFKTEMQKNIDLRFIHLLTNHLIKVKIGI